MDLEKPLTPFIIIRGHKLFLEYEGLRSICFNYGKYGHKKDNCMEVAVPISIPISDQNKSGSDPVDKPKEVGSSTSMQEMVDGSKDPDGYGSCMVVKIFQRRKPQNKPYNEAKKNL